jgi:hypothetical protein
MALGEQWNEMALDGSGEMGWHWMSLMKWNGRTKQMKADFFWGESQWKKGMKLGSTADGMEGNIVGTSIGSTGFRNFCTVTVLLETWKAFCKWGTIFDLHVVHH